MGLGDGGREGGEGFGEAEGDSGGELFYIPAGRAPRAVSHSDGVRISS